VEVDDQGPAGNTDAQARSFYPWDARGSWAEYLVDAESHFKIATQGALVGVKVAFLCLFFFSQFFLFFGGASKVALCVFFSFRHFSLVSVLVSVCVVSVCVGVRWSVSSSRDRRSC
jgi:hypothetical protein